MKILPKKIHVNWEYVSDNKPCLMCIFDNKNIPKIDFIHPNVTKFYSSFLNTLSYSGTGWACMNTWEAHEVYDDREVFKIFEPNSIVVRRVVENRVNSYMHANSFFEFEGEDILIPVATTATQRQDHCDGLMVDLPTARLLAAKVYNEQKVFLFLCKSLSDPTKLGYKIIPSLSVSGILLPDGIYSPMGYTEIELLTPEDLIK